MIEATVQEVTLTDGSKVYNVVTETVRTVYAMENRRDAELLAELLNKAVYVEARP